jgi:serine/threonine-protein kinase
LVGKTIASRYRILVKVGEGGMGTVYKAEHCLMEKIVALKVLHASLLSSKESLDRFRLEIRAASRFQHKNVIQIYDAGEGEGGLFYMAMEFAEGETLEDIIQRRGALPTKEVLSYFRQALAAVGEAHKKGIVHRDLKSGNLMIVADPKTGEQLVKVMDFGIAKFAFDEPEKQGGGLYHTQEGIVTGTPQYMSPEQASGEEVDYRSDLYSLGVIMFELLTGELPFKSNTPMGFLGKHIVEPPPRPGLVKPGIPVVLEEVTLKLLEKRPEDRYQSAEGVLDDLEARCSGEGLSVISTADTHIGGHIPEFAMPVSSESPPPPRRAQTPAPQQTIAVMPQVTLPETAPPKERGHGALVAGLLVLLLIVVTGSTTLVLVLKPDATNTSGSLEVTLGDAQRLVDSNDFAAAIELLKGVEEPTPKVVALLALAEGKLEDVEEAARLAERADQLAESFANGEAGREAAEEALRHYELSLGLHDASAVRARLERVRERLKAKTDPPKPTKQGLALVLEATEALQAGRLDAAKRALDEARRLLPPGDDAVGRLAKHLRGEELLKKGRAERAAGRFDDAKAALTEAGPLLPNAERRERVKTELGEIQEEITKRERAEAIKGLLASALEAGARLDMDAAQTAIRTAKKTADALGLDEPLVASRSSALSKLAALSEGLLSAADELGQLEKNPASAIKGQAQKLLETLRGARVPVGTLKGDPALEKKVSARLEGWIERGATLAKRMESLTEDLKSKKLKRFESTVRRLRKKEAKAAAGVLSQLDDERWLYEFVGLQERSSYVRKECSKEDREWIIERAQFYTRRRLIWQDLKPDEVRQAPEMTAIPGGTWTQPGGDEQSLPTVYYMAITEVTCVEWQRYMKATGAKRPTAFPGPRDEPVRFISLRDAKAYCRWRSKREDGAKRLVEFRVPTEFEWERAARGPKGTAFPWGDRFENWREGYAAISGSLSRVGAFPKDENAWGLKDIVGNVSEITTLAGDPRKVVLRGGSAVSKRADTGANYRKVVKPGDEASGYTGLRILAVER